MDKFVSALQRLCDRYGGYRRVSDTIDANPQTLYQIVSGVKLPSGNARGVGPGLRRKLDEAFPGWADDEEPGGFITTMTVEERELLNNFRALTDQDRERFAMEISQRAKELRDYLDKYLAPIKNGQKTRSQG